MEHEISSGLPDDSREEDEWQEERRLRDLRGRVKHARAIVTTTPGLAEILKSDWKKAARFYARFEVTEEKSRCGIPAKELDDHEEPVGATSANLRYWPERISVGEPIASYTSGAGCRRAESR